MRASNKKNFKESNMPENINNLEKKPQIDP